MKRRLLLSATNISDPHNLGAIIRTAECVGAHGIIIPKRRSAGVTAVVSKTSAGAAEYMAVARVANITAVLSDLKKAVSGYTRFRRRRNTDMAGRSDRASRHCNWLGGGGLSRLVKETCDLKSVFR